MEKKTVTLYTDGACSGNPGPGGYGGILMYGGMKKEYNGGEESTTNNRMEMRAVIEGLSMLKYPCKVEVYSDSAYTVNAFLNGWLVFWQKNGWKKADKKPVSNVDLWQELLRLTALHEVTVSQSERARGQRIQQSLRRACARGDYPYEKRFRKLKRSTKTSISRRNAFSETPGIYKTDSGENIFAAIIFFIGTPYTIYYGKGHETTYRRADKQSETSARKYKEKHRDSV